MSVPKSLLTVAAVLALAPLSSAEDLRTITVSATAVNYSKPDFATIQISAFRKESSAVKAKKQCDAAMSKAIAAIRKLGVKAEDIETSDYNIFPTQDKENGPIKWKVIEAASVKVRNLANVATVIDTAVTNGAPNVSNIQFGLESIGSARTKVRGLAVKMASEKAKALAKLLGVTLGEVQSISEGDDNGVQILASSGKGFSGTLDHDGPTISPGRQAVSLTINVVYAIAKS